MYAVNITMADRGGLSPALSEILRRKRSAKSPAGKPSALLFKEAQILAISLLFKAV